MLVLTDHSLLDILFHLDSTVKTLNINNYFLELIIDKVVPDNGSLEGGT